MTNESLTQEFFERNAIQWYAQFAGTEDYKVYPNFRLPKAMDYFSRLAPSLERAVDIGCGAGIAFKPLTDVGFGKIDAFDFSPNMVDLARAEADRHGLGDRVTLVPGELNTLHPGENLFDAALALGVACYVDDLKAFLADVARVLKPGGVFCLDFRNKAFNLFSTNAYTAELSPEAVRALLDEFAAEIAAYKPTGLAAELGTLCDVSKLPPMMPSDDWDPRAAAEKIAVKNWKKQFDFTMDRTQQSPGEVRAMVADLPIEMVACNFVHFHPFPPVFEAIYPEFFNYVGSFYESLGETPLGFTQASTFLGVFQKTA